MRNYKIEIVRLKIAQSLSGDLKAGVMMLWCVTMGGYECVDLKVRVKLCCILRSLLDETLKLINKWNNKLSGVITVSPELPSNAVHSWHTNKKKTLLLLQLTVVTSTNKLPFLCNAVWLTSFWGTLTKTNTWVTSWPLSFTSSACVIGSRLFTKLTATKQSHSVNWTWELFLFFKQWSESLQ